MESGFIVDGIRILVGLILLVAGRNVFWLFIAAIGFLFGLQIAQLWLLHQPGWMMFAVGALFGLAGAVLAIIFERLAIVLAGFFAGYLLASIAAANFAMVQMPMVLPYLIGALGAVLAALLTDWAIIILSAAVGAAVITSVLSLQPVFASVAFLSLTVTGIYVQRRQFTRRRAP